MADREQVCYNFYLSCRGETGPIDFGMGKRLKSNESYMICTIIIVCKCLMKISIQHFNA